MSMVALSVVGFLYSVPNGPVWLVVLFSAIEGGGFGLAWTFILRRVTGLADRSEIHRISGAIPTVQRMGYALGAAYIGIVANASGLLTMDTPGAAAEVAVRIFFCLSSVCDFGAGRHGHVPAPPCSSSSRAAGDNLLPGPPHAVSSHYHHMPDIRPLPPVSQVAPGFESAIQTSRVFDCPANCRFPAPASARRQQFCVEPHLRPTPRAA